MNYPKEKIEEAVSKSKSIADVIRYLGLKPAATNYRRFIKLFSIYQIDISHFLGQSSNRGKSFPKKRPIEDYLSGKFKINSHNLRIRLIKEGIFKYQCSQCNNSSWQGKPIPLQLDHIDGDHCNNSLNNLRILCPNCHAQTDNYCGKNIKNGQKPSICKCGNKKHRTSKQCKNCNLNRFKK